MARNSAFSRDVAKLAERKRAGLGEPPSMEDLAALYDGSLPEAAADRVREWLAVDPELAATYLQLQQLPDLDAPAADPTPGFDTDDDVDAAWRELSAKIGGDGATPELAIVTPFRRRPLRSALIGLAAMLIVGLGVGWWLSSNEEALPDGMYQPVTITGMVYRGFPITVPSKAVGIEFQIVLQEAEGGEVSVELRDSKNQQIRAQSLAFDAGQQSVFFRVSKSDLVDEEAYELRLGAPAEGGSEPFIFKVSLD